MKKVSSFFVCSVLLAISFVSCTKEGIKPAGSPGLSGATNPTGPVSNTGSANVVFTDWFAAAPVEEDTVNGIHGFTFTKSIPSLTQQVMDSGTVFIYGKLLGYNSSVWATTQVLSLPLSLRYLNGSAMTDSWTAVNSAGNIRIRFENDKNYYSGVSAAHQFRVIVIPGGFKAARLKEPTYQEVCKIYNIPE